MLLVKLITYLLSAWTDLNFTSYNVSYLNAYRYFASKTAYDQIRNRDEAKEVKYSGCMMKQLYFLSRHGTRYPPSKSISFMHDKLPSFRDLILKTNMQNSNEAHQENLNDDILRALKAWNFSLSPEFAMKLAPTGYNEHLELGLRLRQRFPFAVQKSFSDDALDVFFTSTERTKQSVHQLLIGLYGNKVEDKSLLENGENDKLLRFYDICGKTSAESYRGLEEVTKFINGPEVITLQQNLTDRLGLDYCPSFESLFMIYDVCRYETALKPHEFSPWCSLFQTEELKILEYTEDLESYYRSGYPYSIHYERACLIIKDIIDHFIKVTESSNYGLYPKAVLRVSHSELMLKVLARLGLFHDEFPLKATNYQHQRQRQWRCSLIDAFASNIIFILMKCRSGFKVASWFQEKEIKLPGCKASPCSFEEFLKLYNPISNSCLINEACSMFDDDATLQYENTFSFIL